jgi:hypothetical protein
MIAFACATAAEAVRERVSDRIAAALAEAPSAARDGLPSGPAPQSA